MKIFMKNIAIGLSLVTSLAQASEVQIVKSKFFTAKIPDNYDLAITNVQKELPNDCQKLKKQLESFKEFTPESQRRRFAEARTSVGLWQDFSEASFRLLIPIEPFNLKNILGLKSDFSRNIANQNFDSAESSLPFDQLKIESVEVVDLATSSISMKAQSDSLSEVARSLGLPWSPVRILRGTGNYGLEVQGRDLACDLVDGKVSLILSSSVKLRPSVADQDRIGQFYFDLSRSVASQLKRDISLRRKAVGIGFSIGNLLDQYGERNSDAQQKYIGNLIDLIFQNDSLALSEVWNSGPPESRYIGVDKTLEAKVSLRLQQK